MVKHNRRILKILIESLLNVRGYINYLYRKKLNGHPNNMRDYNSYIRKAEKWEKTIKNVILNGWVKELGK